MNRLLTVPIAALIVLSSCSKVEPYTYWAEKRNNQIKRLEATNIKFEIRGTEIWVREKDLGKVVACWFVKSGREFFFIK